VNRLKGNDIVSSRLACFMFLLTLSILLPLPAHTERGVAVRSISPLGNEVTGNQWLFVVGVDSYIHWPRLKTAVNDAKSIRDVLLSRYQFDKEHLIELYDEQATRRNIIDRLRLLAEKVTAEDSLVIFYAGHGHLDSITKEGSWIPVESELREASAWISNHDIKNYLRVDAIKAKHILLVSDSCFSGDFLRGHRGKLSEATDEVIKKAYTMTSRQAISSGGIEPVSDAGFGKNSVFSHFLIRTLRDNQKPFLVPSDFFNHIRAGVAENAQQFPVLGTLRDTGGQEGGELVLFLKQDATLGAVSARASQKREEFERLRQLEAASQESRKREAEEIAKREKEVAALDTEIEGMKKRLGERLPRASDTLDAMLATVRQKEDQEKKLEQLRKQQEEEQQKRQQEIARLRKEKDDQTIAMMRQEVAKYNEIVASKYGKDTQKEAWKHLISRCPEGWAGGVKEGDTAAIVLSPDDRKKLHPDAMEFVFVKGGCFDMGDTFGDGGSDETPVHEVCVNGFYMGKYEVTQRLWKAVMGNNPSYFENCGDSCPVEQISWNDVQEFIQKLNSRTGKSYRLPTERQSGNMPPAVAARKRNTQARAPIQTLETMPGTT
jgi:formylglycine-generating enzyme required for sulfatase activity